MFYKIGRIVLLVVLTFGISTLNVERTSAVTKVMWGKTELKIGQTGKVTILKDTKLVKLNSDGSLSTVRTIKMGEEYRVYSYKSNHSGLYGVGGGSYVQKNAAKVKYETPAKSKLALLKEPVKTGISKERAEHIIRLALQVPHSTSVVYDRETDEDYIIHVYDLIQDDVSSHNATWGWYGVNKKTGEWYDWMESPR